MKKLNNSGFIIADFLFAFTMVIGIGIFIFGFTFSLATIEVAQYIVWSTARNYAAANEEELQSVKQAKEKFENLTAKFPLLTGNGAQIFHALVDGLAVGGSVAHPTVDHHLNHAWHLIGVFIAEALHQRRHHFIAIFFFHGLTHDLNS